MQHLSDHELEQRAKDILLNQLVLTEENKIGLHPINREGEYWIKVFTHLLEEFQIRHGRYPAGFKNGFIKEVRIPNPSLDMASKACNIVKSLKIEPGRYLFKFSKFKWLEEVHEKGIIRISPAASYNDPSLNSAIQDDELKFAIQSNSLGVNVIHESLSNYYVYCMSSSFIPRLFLDFDADACLIIRKPQEFISKLLSAFKKYKPDWKGVHKNVKYLDPLNSTSNQVDVFSSKHFRYSYQKENRLIWLPPTVEKELGFQFIELGSLEDCSELVNI